PRRNVPPSPACDQTDSRSGLGRFDAAPCATTKALTTSVAAVLPLTMGAGGFSAPPILPDEGAQASARGKLTPATPLRLIVTSPDWPAGTTTLEAPRVREK